MQASSGRFRVYESERRPDGLAFAVVPSDPLADDSEAYERVEVAREGHDVGGVDALEPGMLVDASLSWQSEPPTVDDVSVVATTRFSFARDVTGLFEAATATWGEAKRRGDGVNSRVTQGTDGTPNGALYTFAAQPGRDLFAEFRYGTRPLDPLLARIDDRTASDASAVPADVAPGGVDAVSTGGDDAVSTGGDDAVSTGGDDAVSTGGDPTGARSGSASDVLDWVGDSSDSGREVFVLEPAEERCVVVYVALDRDGLLASTVRDTYDVTTFSQR